MSYRTYRSRIASRNVLFATLTVWGQIRSRCPMKGSLVQRFQKSQLSRSALLSLYNFRRLSINVRSYEIWTTSRWWYVWNSDFKFDMACKASERVLSDFKTTLSWLGARSYVVMLSEVGDLKVSLGNYSLLHPNHCFGNYMRNPGWIPHNFDSHGSYIPDRFGS